MSSEIIKLTNVTKTYGTGSLKVTALRGVTTEVHENERVALLGRSGSGKSTLLNLIGGLDHATSGNVMVARHELSQFSPTQMADFRLSTVGMIFQNYNLIPSKSALENVELPLVFRGIPRRTRREMCCQMLNSMGLVKRLDHRPSQLSGGEQQRVAIARAIVTQPKLLLADEPTGNLDSVTASDVMQLLEEHLIQFSISLILVTHDESLAVKHTDRVLRLSDGKIAGDVRADA